MSLNAVFVGGDEELCFVVLTAISDVTAGDSSRKTPTAPNHEHVVLSVSFSPDISAVHVSDFIVNFKISFTMHVNILPDHIKNSN